MKLLDKDWSSDQIFTLKITSKFHSNHMSVFSPGYNPGWVGAMAVQGPADWSGNSQSGSTRHCSTNSRHCATRGTPVHLAGRTQANGTLWSPWQWQDHDSLQCLESSAWHGGVLFGLEYQRKLTNTMMEFSSDSIYNFIAYDTMKTRLLESEAEAENRPATSLGIKLWLVDFSPSASNCNYVVFIWS